jgi:hypothetical protein
MEIQDENSLRGELVLALAKVDKLTVELEDLSRKVIEADRKVKLADEKVNIKKL